MSDAVLERAFDHVCSSWFPVQVQVLDKIRARLDSGVYSTNRRALTIDLKEDFSLFMFCLKQLQLLTAEDADSRPPMQGEAESVDPVSIIEKADFGLLKKILHTPASEISKHSMQQSTKLQTLRVGESMISASTAEVLAAHAKIDPDLGFSCGLLRQLGLTLIAWNYPRLYAKAVETLSAKETLDSALHRALGFSPSLLGQMIAQRWGLSDDIVSVVATSLRTPPVREKNAQEDNNEKAAGSILAKICEVGEALARANNPDIYPTAQSDWERAEKLIKEQIGPDGVQKIFERAKENCRQYLKQHPDLLSVTEATAIKERVQFTAYSKPLLEKNTYIKSCSPETAARLSALYLKLRPNQVIEPTIRELVFDVIPGAGFPSGCVLMLDPHRKVLSPVLKFGAVPAERLKSVGLKSVASQFDIIASAFSCKSPLTEQFTDAAGKKKMVVAAALGLATPIGVLYLESTEESLPLAGKDPVQTFRALRQALNDCLNLR